MQLCSPNIRFQWSDELEKELQDLKQCLKDHIKISPINTEKNLELVIDAAPTVGTSYLLLQRKGEDPSEGFNFISMDSANFGKGQTSLCCLRRRSLASDTPAGMTGSPGGHRL